MYLKPQPQCRLQLSFGGFFFIIKSQKRRVSYTMNGLTPILLLAAVTGRKSSALQALFYF